jgi:dihydrofolate synthase/folylpolyglutamate synthase
LYGDHQGQNAALAIAAVEAFVGGGSVPLSTDVLAEGLAEATSPGRLQLIGIEPTVLVDAAHNPHGARALAGAMTEYFDFEQIAIVIAVLGDKDAHGVFAELAPIASRFYVTRSHSDRATPVEELAAVAHTVAPEESVLQVDDFAEAVDAAREWAAGAPSRAVLITGSITLVGEALALAGAGGWKP